MNIIGWSFAIFDTYREFFNQHAGLIIVAWALSKGNSKHILTAPIIIGLVMNFVPSFDKIREIEAVDKYYTMHTDEEIIDQAPMIKKHKKYKLALNGEKRDGVRL